MQIGNAKNSIPNAERQAEMLNAMRNAQAHANAEAAKRNASNTYGRCLNIEAWHEHELR